MKHEITASLEVCLTEEIVDLYASIRSSIFGDIVLGALGINGDCIEFRKSLTKGNYIITYGLENAKEYQKTYRIDEIMKAFKGKTLHMEMEVKRDD